ncbi:MAG TPA: hypothetical protein VNJ04_20110 [Gemmatimonadaceae bacterium]|nr:hypothetical protein [Gemmatimonadaceae bacterium]
MRRLLMVLALSATAALTSAQETVTLATPAYVSAGAVEFRVESVYLKRAHPDSAAEVRGIFRETVAGAFVPLGRTLTCRYESAAAEALMVSFNKANLSTSSLERRVLAKCQQDGKLGAGTISGVPQ